VLFVLYAWSTTISQLLIAVETEIHIVKNTQTIDVKKFLRFYYFFYKNALFNVLFFERLLFSSGEILILLNLLNSYIKRFLSDEFNMAAIGNSLIKSHTSQTLSLRQ